MPTPPTSSDPLYNPQLVDKHNLLFPYFMLCDRETEKAVLDPCFFAYNVALDCMHNSVVFADGKNEKKPKEGDSVNCEECRALKRIIYSNYDGVTEAADYLDGPKVHQVSINLANWDLVNKKGDRFPTRAHRDAHGNIDCRLDYMYNQDLKRGDKFGQALSDDEIQGGESHVKLIPYRNENTVAIFEIPDIILDTNWLINLTIKSIMMQRFKDVKFYRMKTAMTGFQHTPEYTRERVVSVDDLLKQPQPQKR
jgi:hypothetical protein